MTMVLSIQFIHRLRDEKDLKSKCSKLSEININSTNDWDKDLSYRWTSNACAECNNQECILQHILALENLQSESRSSDQVKEFVVKSLADVLSNKSSTNNALRNETSTFFEKVFHGCNCILSNIKMQQYFKSDVKKLTLLIKSFLEFESLILKTSNPVIKMMAQNSLSSVFDYFLQIYKQFSDKELFAMSFLKNILFPFCNLTKTEETDHSKIDSELHRCIQTLLFAKFFLPQYKKFNSESEGIPATLFSTLEKIANADSQVAFTVFEVVLCVAVKSYESDSKVVDLIFRNMIQCSGRDKKILKKLLDCLTGIHLSMDNKIENVTLFEFLTKYVDEILTQENLDNIDYELIIRIVNINPFTIEKNFENILLKVLPKKSKVSESSYNDFFMAILNASICLRREHKLIQQLLIVTKDVLVQNTDAEIFLPEEFLTKFMESVSNITISQTTTILRSLIFHFKLYCVDISLPAFSKSDSVMLEIIVRLITPFMKGIKIFECVRNVNAQKKFCRALVDLGSSFSSMTDRFLKLDGNKRVIFTFVKACQAWNDVCNLISHYVSTVASDELATLFSTKKWLKLVAKVESLSEEDYENVGFEFSQALLINLTKEEKFIDSLNCKSPFWISVALNNPGVLSNLSDVQLSEIAETVVTEFTKDFSEKKRSKSKTNVGFVSAVINQILVKCETNIKSNTTKQFLGKIVPDFKWKKVISKLKKGSLMGKETEFTKNSKTKDSKAIKEYFNLLSSIHLSHLHHDVRIVLFILISSVSLEFSHDDQISEKCNELLLDLLQENDIDIFKFSNLQFLHSTRLGNKVLSQVFELPLKNDSFNSLIKFLDSNEISNEMVSVFLNTIQRTKFHRNSEENQTLRNLIGKWNNQSIEKNYSTVNLVSLTFTLKDAVVGRNVCVELKESTNQTLQDIFQNSDKESKITEECLQLLELVLRNRSYLEITSEIISLISTAILHNSSENILRPFLETLNSDELTLFLKSLQKQTICALGEESEGLLKNCILIWEYIVIIEMALVRNNLRLSAVNNLLYRIEETCIFEKHWLCLLKLFETIISSKFMQITGQNIDLILLSCMKCMKRVGVAVCREILSLYTIIVKLRANFVKEKLSLLVLLNREIIKSLSDEGQKLGNANDQYQLECLVLDLEKFVIALKKLGGNVSEICPYMLTDLVEWYCCHLLPKNLKNSLEIIIQHLLSTCEHETIEFLNRTLPLATQKIFKELVTMYRRHYKFTGKI